MISVIPAIDIMDGQCVRLSRGDFDRQTVYAISPLEVASRYVEAGFNTLHLVDLDGARQGHSVQLGVLEEIVASTGARVQFGGGVQSEEDVRSVLDAGAARVVIGSLAVNDRALLLRWFVDYGAEHLVIAADSLHGSVRTDAWRQESNVAVLDLLRDYGKSGAQWALCTDVSRDGEMRGPALELYEEIKQCAPELRLIASGGVRSRDDVEALDSRGVDAVVIGKALLERAIDLRDLAEFAC